MTTTAPNTQLPITETHDQCKIRLNEELIMLCREDPLVTLQAFVANNKPYLDIRFRNYAAYRILINRCHFDLCLFLNNELGPLSREYLCSLATDLARVETPVIHYIFKLLKAMRINLRLDAKTCSQMLTDVCDRGDALLMIEILGYCSVTKPESAWTVLMTAITLWNEDFFDHILELTAPILKGMEDELEARRFYRGLLIQCASTGNTHTYDQIINEFEIDIITREFFSGLSTSFRLTLSSEFLGIMLYHCAHDVSGSMLPLFVEKTGFTSCRIGQLCFNRVLEDCKNDRVDVIDKMMAHGYFSREHFKALMSAATSDEMTHALEVTYQGHGYHITIMFAPIEEPEVTDGDETADEELATTENIEEPEIDEAIDKPNSPY